MALFRKTPEKRRRLNLFRFLLAAWWTISCSAAQATDVFGLITEDTSWLDTSEPYRVLSHTEVRPDVTLTIGPGVTVIGVAENTSLQVFGTLEIQGEKSAKTLIQDVLIMAGTTVLPKTFQLNIDNAIFEGGSILAPYTWQAYGSLQLTNSTLIGTDPIVIDYPVREALIEGNVFENAGGIVTGSDQADVIIRRNRFSDWQGIYPAIFNLGNGYVCDIDCVPTSTIVEQNDFLSTHLLAIEVGSGSNLDLVAINNWWGTVDESVIQDMIRDNNDHPVLPTVVYLPFAEKPFTFPQYADVPDITGFADVSGDAVPDVAGFVDGGTDRPTIAAYSGMDGAVFATIEFINDNWQGLSLGTVRDSDQDGTADDPAVAMLVVNKDSDRIRVETRRLDSGAFLSSVQYFNANWRAIDVVVVDDLNGDGNSNDTAIAVLAERVPDGRIQLQLRDYVSGALILNTVYLNARWTPIAAAVADRSAMAPAGTLPPLIAVIAEEPGGGKRTMQVRVAETGTFDQNIKFLGSTWDYQDVSVNHDANSDGVSDDPTWMVLATRPADNVIRVQSRFVVDGSFDENIVILNENWQAFRLDAANDMNGDLSGEMAISAKRRADGVRRIHIKDYASGNTTINIAP